MKETRITRTEQVSELNGEYWGVQYEDGHSISYDFGPIENAKFSSSGKLTKPEYLTYSGSGDVEKLKKAKVVNLIITTIYQIED